MTAPWTPATSQSDSASPTTSPPSAASNGQPRPTMAFAPNPNASRSQMAPPPPHNSLNRSGRIRHFTFVPFSALLKGSASSSFTISTCHPPATFLAICSITVSLLSNQFEKLLVSLTNTKINRMNEETQKALTGQASAFSLGAATGAITKHATQSSGRGALAATVGSAVGAAAASGAGVGGSIAAGTAVVTAKVAVVAAAGAAAAPFLLAAGAGYGIYRLFRKS